MTFTRITVDPDVMAGVPVLRGMRIPVSTVILMLADGVAVEEVCRELPDLEPGDVAEALRYAALAVRDGDLQVARGDVGLVSSPRLGCEQSTTDLRMVAPAGLPSFGQPIQWLLALMACTLTIGVTHPLGCCASVASAT